MLDEAGIKAAFFLVGEQVERRPALAAEIADRGHVIALHAYRHRPQPALSARAVEEDLTRGRDAIESAVGRPVGWHRPPYGLYSPRRARGRAARWAEAAALVEVGQGLAPPDHAGTHRGPSDDGPAGR